MAAASGQSIAVVVSEIATPSEIDTTMPVLAKFYGIVIRMFRVRGMPARFHAIYHDAELVVEIAPLRVVQGNVPARIAQLVLAWARTHQAELLAAWGALLHSRKPATIGPLD